MACDPEKLVGNWVEVREEGAPGKIVLRPFSAPLPPARGRRGIVLADGNVAEARQPGASDRNVGSRGSWSVDGDRLTLEVAGWSGRYRIENEGEDKLILSAE